MLLKMKAQGLDADDSRYRQAMKACTMANDPTQVISPFKNSFPFNGSSNQFFFVCVHVYPYSVPPCTRGVPR